MATLITMNLLNPSNALKTRQNMLAPRSRSISVQPLMKRVQQNSRAIKMEIGSGSRSTLVMKKSRGCSSCGGAR